MLSVWLESVQQLCSDLQERSAQRKALLLKTPCFAKQFRLPGIIRKSSTQKQE
jgi:hypothetical protein